MQRIMIGSVSWIGDVIMCMPAVEALRQAHPEAHICVLAKPGIDQLWKLHPAPDDILLQEKGCHGVWRTLQRIRKAHPETAYILPHSFRSAFLPFMAGVKSRIGTTGHHRDWMLTTCVCESGDVTARHQAYEYFNLFDLELPSQISAPALSIPQDVLVATQEQLSSGAGPCMGFLPGAARGPSKQWPMDHFIELGNMLTRTTGGTILLMGSKAEQALCRTIRQEIHGDVEDLSGRTTLAEWAAMLAHCDVVVANDSGGMHLASAVGTPVVALYGITDPSKTGPLGETHTILQNSTTRSRDVARDTEEARRALAAIQPRQACEAVMSWIARTSL